MAVAPLLQRFVEDELARSTALIERCLTGTLQLLRQHRDGLTSSEREHHFVLVEALQQGGTRYRTTFLEALRDGVQRELDTREPGAGRADAGETAGLELMDESRVEVDIEISRAMQIIDSTAEWELRELQTFTSTLCGQQHVSAERRDDLHHSGHPCPQPFRARTTRPPTGEPDSIRSSAWAMSGVNPAAVNNRST